MLIPVLLRAGIQTPTPHNSKRALYLNIKTPKKSPLWCPADNRSGGCRTSSAITGYSDSNGSNQVPSSYASHGTVIFQFWSASSRSCTRIDSLTHPSSTLMFTDGSAYWYVTLGTQTFYVIHGRGANIWSRNKLET